LKYERGWKEKAKRRKEIRVGAHGSSIDVKLNNNNQSLNLIARKENNGQDHERKITFLERFLEKSFFFYFYTIPI